MIAFFGIAPIFSATGFPNQAKIGLAGFLAAIILFLRGTEIPNIELEFWSIATLAAGEILVGMILGFIVGLLFAAMQLAGYIMGYQMGFAVANVLDPIGGDQVSVLGEFIFLFGLLTFLNVDGHHMFLIGMTESYDIVPLGKAGMDFNLVNMMAGLFQTYFSIAIKMSLPILGIILMLDVSLGIVARTVPQMNVFMVGLPLKTLIGIFIMFISFSFLRELMRLEVYDLMIDFYKFVHTLA